MSVTRVTFSLWECSLSTLPGLVVTACAWENFIGFAVRSLAPAHFAVTKLASLGLESRDASSHRTNFDHLSESGCDWSASILRCYSRVRWGVGSFSCPLGVIFSAHASIFGVLYPACAALCAIFTHVATFPIHVSPLYASTIGRLRQEIIKSIIFYGRVIVKARGIWGRRYRRIAAIVIGHSAVVVAIVAVATIVAVIVTGPHGSGRLQRGCFPFIVVIGGARGKGLHKCEGPPTARVSAAGRGTFCHIPSSSSSSPSSQGHSKRSACKKGGGKDQDSQASSQEVCVKPYAARIGTSDNNLGDTPERRPHAPSTTTTTTGTATRDSPLPSSAPRPLDGDDGRDSNGTTHPRHPNNDGTATTTSPSARTPDDSDDMGLAEGTPCRHWSRALPTTATVTTRAATEGIPLPAPAPHTLGDHGTTHLPCAPSTMTTTVTQFTHAGSVHPRSPTACNPYDNDDYEGDSDRRSDPMARHGISLGKRSEVFRSVQTVQARLGPLPFYRCGTFTVSSVTRILMAGWLNKCGRKVLYCNISRRRARTCPSSQAAHRQLIGPSPHLRRRVAHDASVLAYISTFDIQSRGLYMREEDVTRSSHRVDESLSCSSAQRDVSIRRLSRTSASPSVWEDNGERPREYLAFCVVYDWALVSGDFSNSPSLCVFGAITTIGLGEETKLENGNLESVRQWLTVSATMVPGPQSGSLYVHFPSARAYRTRGFSIRTKVRRCLPVGELFPCGDIGLRGPARRHRGLYALPAFRGWFSYRPSAHVLSVVSL
ncbi:hypothetical protein EDB83DRAFT_2327244 [Lactarius deliciosus]|nr:hypothetical protein EDB83DRAFT_2327244 [Lactarius deliciosus]